MSKIAILCDSHFGVKKGDDIMASYFGRFFNEIFFPEIDKRGITHVIHLGDLFDPRSEVATNVFDQIKEYIINPLRERGIRFDMVLGNHDTRYKNTNLVNTPATLFGLDSGQNLKGVEDTYLGKLVIDDIYEFKSGNFQFAMVPWLSHDNQDRLIEAINKSKSHVVMGHFEITGARMDRYNVAKHGINHSMFNRFRMVLSGHFHHKSKYGNVEYLGTQYEMTWVDSGDPKGFHILDTETLDMEFIQNPITMFNTVQFDGESEIDVSSLKGTKVRLYVAEGADPVKVNSVFSKIEEMASEVTITDNRRPISQNEDIQHDDMEISSDTPEETLSIIREYILANVPEDREDLYNVAIEHINELYRTVNL